MAAEVLHDCLTVSLATALRDRGAHVLVEQDRADHVGGTIQVRPVVAAR
jgi:hypothetical protein